MKIKLRWLMKSRRRAKSGAVAVSLLFGALILGACGGGSSDESDTPGAAVSEIQTTDNPQPGGTLDIATPLEPATLDPAVGQTDAGSQHAQDLIFDRLVDVRPGSFETEPGLAESWTLSPDKSTMTFELRDASFSNGTPVTSRDVKFSLERAIDPEVDPGFADAVAAQFKSISTPDDRTVVFKEPGPALVSWLSFLPCSIISQEAFEEMGAKEFGLNPVGAGSGPFELVKWTQGESVEYTRNPNFWRDGLPYLDAVNLLIVPDDNTRMLKIRSGEVQAADDVPYSQTESLSTADGLRVESSEIAAVYGPWISSAGPLKDVEVRQALNYAAPKEAIIDVALAGQGEPFNSFIPAMKYWDESIPAYPDDVEKAKELMAQSSVPDGFDLELVVQGGDAVSEQTAEILQDAWGEIGVNVRVQQLEKGAFNARLFEGEFQALLQPPSAASSDIPSEDEFAFVLTTPFFRDVFHHNDPKLNQLAQQAQETFDEDERQELFSQYQAQIMENPMNVPITLARSRTALSDEVQNFGYVPMNWYYLDETSLSP